MTLLLSWTLVHAKVLSRSGHSFLHVRRVRHHRHGHLLPLLRCFPGTVIILVLQIRRVAIILALLAWDTADRSQIGWDEGRRPWIIFIIRVGKATSEDRSSWTIIIGVIGVNKA
jgi:hypothetical protein